MLESQALGYSDHHRGVCRNLGVRLLWSVLAACGVDDRAVSVGVGLGGADAAAGGASGGTGGVEASGAGGRVVDASDAGAAAGQGGSLGGAGGCLSSAGGGAPCDGGTCRDGACIALPFSECAVDVVGAVPFTTGWSSVGRSNLYNGGCDTLGTPDYALVFVAPQAGAFRVASAALVDEVPYTGPGDPSGVPDGPADGDAVMTVVRGNCAGQEAQQLACNDDVSAGSIDSRLDLELDAGEVVTVYLNELAQTGGGTGTVSINPLP